jgi:hypothetical protein
MGTAIDENDDIYLQNQKTILENKLRGIIPNNSSELEVSSVRRTNRITETVNSLSDSSINDTDIKVKTKKTKQRSKIKIET